jgi:uncharacterized protein (TIGR01777 family)
MIITLLGGSGFIGRALADALRSRGDTVRIASLRDPARAAEATAGSDVVVNLAGASVAERWTDAQKRAINSTRVDLPHAFLSALERFEQRPTAYVSASAIGYYGTSRTATFTETSPTGDDFLARVCAAWEAEAMRARALGMRVAIVRTGIVLGTDGGALAKLLPLFRIGLGGVVASGEQWYSWIHLADQVGVYLLAIDGYDGVLNATAPHPVKNSAFTQALASAVHRPALFPAPEFALKLVLGEGAYVVTEGQRVLPEIGPALTDIVG